jgi:eukaryotic-like serine/threonine-protein kinase
LRKSRSALWLDRKRLDESVQYQLPQLSKQARQFLQTSRSTRLRQRWMFWGLLMGVPLIIVTVITVSRLRIQAEANRRVAIIKAEKQREIDHLLSKAQSQLATAQNLDELVVSRAEAMKLFDAKKKDDAESKWRVVLENSRVLDSTYALAARELEAAMVIDGTRTDVRGLLIDTLNHRAHLADAFYLFDKRDESLQRLELYDTKRQRLAEWATPAEVSLKVTPLNATIRIASIVKNDGLRVEGPATPFTGAPLAAGTYMFTLSAPGKSEVRYPITLAPGEKYAVSLTLPDAATVPNDFAVVLPGRFLVGVPDETSRTNFLFTVPIHEMRTDGFMIGKHETTFAEWIEFLDALPEAERKKYLPRAGGGNVTASDLELRQIGSGWQLQMTRGDTQYVVNQKQKIRYANRKHHQEQDWLKMPVVGVSMIAVEAYAKWLDKTGRVRNARACSETEWERAARGSDDRVLPHGDFLASNQANFFATHNGDVASGGLDEVGNWPASNSPFGIYDMAGNAWEWTTLSMTSEVGMAATRGGAYFYGALVAWSVNRNIQDPIVRFNDQGVRVCSAIFSVKF